MSESSRRAPGTWFYRARVLRVIDGDTIEFRIDVGFGMEAAKVRVRLLGVNAPEIKGVQKAAGVKAHRFTAEWLLLGHTPDYEWEWVIQTQKTDHFGRYLATVWRVRDGRCLNDDLAQYLKEATDG